MGQHRWRWIARAICCSLLVALGATSHAQQPTAEADAARARCDEAAGHPRDPGRYLAGVPDERLSPGPAREACELAVRLNPEMARLWFQLGRAYWAVGNDAEAFRAFNEAARRNYPAAKKYMGDAYYTGRGLPTGQKQDAQRALALYRQAAEGNFDDAILAIRDLEAKIKEQDKAKFDASIFQRSDIMLFLYTDHDIPPLPKDAAALTMYLKGFADQFAGAHTPILFLPDGQYCKPLLRGATYAAIKLAAMANLGDLNTIMRSKNQGESDAVTLFNRYGCQSDVTQRIMSQLNDLFSSKDRRKSNEGSESGQVILNAKCQRQLNEWRRYARPHGFFVLMNGECAWNGGRPSKKGARDQVTAECERQTAKCTIIEER